MKLFESSLIDNGREPDIIEEVSDTLTYIGFLDNGDLTTALIKKIETTGTITTTMYPNGSRSVPQNWADRAILNYAHKK